VTNSKFAKSVWQKSTAIMEKYNEPGRFTAIIAYEWTSNAGGGDNLHRNVIYRDGKDKADQMIPYTTFQSENPEDLWKWMDAYEEKTGGSLLAIPHNGNLSNGRMFELKTFTGARLLRNMPRSAHAGSRCSRRSKPRDRANRILRCRRPTNSTSITSCGTGEISISCPSSRA
jgi:hypothetical protein